VELKAFQTNASDAFQQGHWYITHISNHYIRLPYFQISWKETRQGPRIPSKFISIKTQLIIQDRGARAGFHGPSFIHTYIFRLASCPQWPSYSTSYTKNSRKSHEETELLNASLFIFRTRHSTTLQYVRLTDHVMLNLTHNMSTATVYLDNEKVYDTKWHTGLLHK
jgi:hypothetical protein